MLNEDEIAKVCNELLESDRKELIKSQRNKIDALIFLGVTRAKVQLKKAIKAGNKKNSAVKRGLEFYLDGNMLDPEFSFLPRTKEIHGVPSFKKSCTRDLIYLIADDNFWHQFYKGFSHNIVEGAYKTRFHAPDLDSAIQRSVIFKFNFAPDIKISKNCFAERSILLRVIYALCGYNPYENSNFENFEKQILFEMAMLRSSIKRLEAFHDLLGLQTEVDISFTIALRKFLDLLKNSKEALEGLFILWKKNKDMEIGGWGDLVSKEFSDALIEQAKAEKDSGLQETKAMKLIEMSEKIQYEQKFHSLHIEKNLIIKIWGGTLKSFNRIQSDKLAKGEPTVMTYEKSDLLESKRKNYITIQDAIDFLQSREIDWVLKNEQRLDDFSYKYIAYLEKKISENSTDLTMKSAINALEETDISDASMRNVLI